MASRSKKKKKVRSRPEDYLKRLRALGGTDFSMFDKDPVATLFTEFIPTGLLALDRQIRGWPIGAICELASWEHVGKSTLLDLGFAQAQAVRGIAVLIDNEKAREPVWMQRNGVDTSKLIVYQADTIEASFKGVDEACKVQESFAPELRRPMLIGLDSIGGTPTKAELEGEPDDKHMAVAAKVIKMNLRRITQRLGKLRIGLVIANHFYEGIGKFGGGLKTYGGNGIRYHSAARVWLTQPGKVKIGDEEVGHIVRVTPKKNRIRGVREPLDTALIYGSGFSNAYTLFEWGRASSNGEGAWIQRRGSWYWLYVPGEDPISFQQQCIGLDGIFRSRPEVYQQMSTAFMNADG